MDAYALACRGIEALLHRGPDGIGVIGDAGSAIAMARLQVRSAPDDTVPFTLGDAAYAFNGEVYDADSTTPAGGLGEATAAGSGPDRRLDGMYAVLRRGPDGVIEARRDPLGIKPLYLYESPGVAALASEQVALLRAFGVPPIRPQAIAQFLLLGRVVDGGGFYEGIRPVRRGERLVLHRGRAIGLRSDERRPSSASARAAPTAVELHRALALAVDRVLLSRRPVGLAVSGGLDSSILADELARRGIRGVTTVSIRPDGSSDGVDDLAELELPGTAWRTWRHHWAGVGPAEFLDALPEVVACLHEPTGLTSAPLYAALARAARAAGIVVLLVGEGADELFGGYRSYLELAAASSAEEFLVPSGHRSVIGSLVGTPAVDEAMAALGDVLPTGTPTTAIRSFERDHSLEPLLRRCDHFLMAQGVEGRPVFLHGGLPELAEATPWAAMVGDGQTKRSLRDAWTPRLPRFADETKVPFRAPLSQWFTGDTGARVTRQIDAHRERLVSIGIDSRGIDTLLDALLDGRPGAGNTAYALLTLGEWTLWLDSMRRREWPPSSCTGRSLGVPATVPTASPSSTTGGR